MTRKVFVQQPYAGPVQRMFFANGYEVVDNIPEADIIAFTGGEDINPALYGEQPLPAAHVWFNEHRDQVELAGYRAAHDLGKFKFGICRGGQLLNVMNGGRLWQDVDNHTRNHLMTDQFTGEVIKTSSVHHQQFILGEGGVVVATAEESTRKLGGLYGEVRVGDENFGPDIEVAWYPHDRALCIQGHPEYGGYGQMTDYCFRLIDRYFEEAA